MLPPSPESRKMFCVRNARPLTHVFLFVCLFVCCRCCFNLPTQGDSYELAGTLSAVRLLYHFLLGGLLFCTCDFLLWFNSSSDSFFHSSSLSFSLFFSLIGKKRKHFRESSFKEAKETKCANSLPTVRKCTIIPMHQKCK